MTDHQQIPIVCERFEVGQLTWNGLHGHEQRPFNPRDGKFFRFTHINQQGATLAGKTGTYLLGADLKSFYHKSVRLATQPLGRGEFGTLAIIVNGFARSAQPIDRFLARYAVSGPGKSFQTLFRNVLIAAQTNAEAAFLDAV